VSAQEGGDTVRLLLELTPRDADHAPAREREVEVPPPVALETAYTPA
jgi:hypothetical protein